MESTHRHHRAETSFLAQRVSVFSLVMGVALLLTGIGFLVLTTGALRLPETRTA